MKHFREWSEPIMQDMVNRFLAEMAAEKQAKHNEFEASEELDLLRWQQDPRNFGPDNEE